MSCYHIIERRKAHRGFTLIELLVVIVIIGILASLIIVGATSARNAALRAIIKNEIAQVEGALARYLQKYGEYPPDFSDEDAVMRHVRKRWSAYNPGSFANLCKDIHDGSLHQDSNGVWYAWDFSDPDTASHMAALAFWLGGMPEPATGLLGGFSADVSNPMKVISVRDGGQRETPFMELTLGKNCQMFYVLDDDKRIGSGTKIEPYLVMPAIVARESPIVYFKASAAGDYLVKGDPKCFHCDDFEGLAGMGHAVPYAKSGASFDNAVWHNPKSFQLIHPGLDKDFGAGGHPDFRVIDPANDFAVKISLADKDNQANFGGVTIESAGN